MKRSTRGLLAASLCFCLAYSVSGCANPQMMQQLTQTIIQLSGLGGGGGMGNGGGFLPPITGGSSGPGPANPGFPGGQSKPPTQPWTNQQQPPLPTSAQEALKELATKYGIKLTGPYGEYDVKNALNCARLYKPEFTQQLTMRYSGRNFHGGIAGTWENYGAGGFIQIYDSKGPSTTAHEMMHHVALASRNRQTSMAKTNQMIGSYLPGRRPRRAARNLIPTNYAMTNADEWIAEACSLYAIKVRNLDCPYWRNAVFSSFNPHQPFRDDMKYLMSDS